MLNPSIKSICEFVDSWCSKHDIPLKYVCDESEFRAIQLYKRDRQLLGKLLDDLKPLVTATGVYLETTKVRGGTILAFSIKAISETTLAALIAEAGEEIMSFAEKITEVFSQTVAKSVVESTIAEPNQGDFLMTAIKVVDESQYKSPLDALGRSTLERNSHRPSKPAASAGKTTTDKKKSTAIGGDSQAATGPDLRFESRVATTMGSSLPSRRRLFGKQLDETLQGMATPNGAQAGDLFTKFAQALSAMGNNMGTGPLQDQLKKQGINWKKSDDGQSVMLYVVNAQTNAPQAIARISAATLEKPSDFETQLLNIMDFAKGDAPGTFKQRQQELQSQEKAAREIAKQLGPQDESSIAQQMQPQAPGLQGMATPDQGPVGDQPLGAPPAPQAAATQAAMPKTVGM